MRVSLVIAAFASFMIPSRALDVPANIKAFYNNAKAQGQCQKPIKSGLYSYYGGPPGTSNIKTRYVTCQPELATHT